MTSKPTPYLEVLGIFPGETKVTYMYPDGSWKDGKAPIGWKPLSEAVQDCIDSLDLIIEP